MMRVIMNDIRPMKKALALVFTLALAASMGLHTVSAQTEPVRFVISPEIPGPNQAVRIEVQGIGTFLGDSTITWQKDGVTALSGAGERVFTFTTGAVGVATRINIVIDSAVQGRITRSFTFIPAVINLVWEANTTVPPLYRGKALYTPGSSLKVLALPQVVANGATISSNNLSFQWSIHDEPAPALSGKGRSTLSFTGSQLRLGEQVDVDVYFGDVPVARGSLFIPATEPQLLVYNQDPLRGVLYDQALPQSVVLSGREVTLKAEPYYFAKESVRDGTLTYEWLLNGEKTAGPESARGALTLRQTGEGAGQAQLAISLQNIDPTKFVQVARTGLNILFGQQTSGGASPFGI